MRDGPKRFRSSRYQPLEDGFPLGSSVLVHAAARTERAYSEGRHEMRREIVRTDRLRKDGTYPTGMVCGATSLLVGYVDPGSAGSSMPYGEIDPEPPTFVLERAVPALVVAIGYGRRVNVLPEDAERVSTDTPGLLFAAARKAGPR